jgi:hypothetical protein
MENKKVVHEHVWCTMCRLEGHSRDECPTLGNYLVNGALNQFPTGPWTKLCDICRQWWHIPPHFPTLDKYQKTHHTLFFEFYKSTGHDVNNFWSLHLMQDHTHDAFRLQEEHKGVDHGGKKRGEYQGSPIGRYGWYWGWGCGGGGGIPPTFYDCG